MISFEREAVIPSFAVWLGNLGIKKKKNSNTRMANMEEIVL